MSLRGCPLTVRSIRMWVPTSSKSHMSPGVNWKYQFILPLSGSHDAGGKLLRAWGGPSDPGWLASHCKEEAGCIWPNAEHGIYVDDRDNVWIAGNSDNVPKDATAC